MLGGLIKNGISVIEYGNAGGIGAYEVSNSVAPLTDLEYLQLAQPYVDKAEIGMFLNAKRYREKYVELAAEHKMSFLRVGADAGDGALSLEPLKAIKANGMKARYSLMKAYILSPEDLTEESKMLEAAGADEITIMDSAGCMTPDDVARYTQAMVKGLSIPVGFHGHNNLGFSAANAIAAQKNGAAALDCGLLGMARSAGNLATEVAAALMQKSGELVEVDFYGLLDYLDNDLIPAMKTHDYHVPIMPVDLILGISGCHSSFIGLFKEVAAQHNVSLYRLIVEVSAIDRKAPGKELIESVALSMKV